MRQTLALIAIAAASFAAAWWFVRGQGVDAPPAAAPGAAAPPEGAPPRAAADERRDADAALRRALAAGPDAPQRLLDEAVDALRAAIHSGQGGPEAAADLRRLLRLDPGAFAAAGELLLAGDTDGELRAALAMVIGSIADEQTDLLLTEALRRYGAVDAALCIALIAALGAMREPADEDDVFDLEAAPHFGVAGPGGIGVTVRREIDDPIVQQELGNLLLDRERPAVRRAAADALRFSLDHELCRARFQTAVQIENDDGTASVLAESLGRWARAHGGLEADQIAGMLVARADQPGFAEYRLRLETALEGLPLGAADLARARTWTAVEQPFELRAFAFTLLARQPQLAAADRAALERALHDPDVPVRDLAARLLGTAPPAPSTVAALRSVFAQSPEWSVRSSALAALAALLPAAERQALLDAAAQDADPRIARRAMRLQGQGRR